jgi:hypothetical protein
VSAGARGVAAFVPPKGIECADLTARKVHQYTVVGVALLALLLGGGVGVALLALDGVIMLVGRFWGPADVVRQFVWRVAEPRGWLVPNMVPEDLSTRRVARVLGGLVLLGAAAAMGMGSWIAAGALTLALSLMILLDATANFCLLCFLNYQLRLLRYRLTH